MARSDGTDITWLHHDHLGSPVAASDLNGAEKWREVYLPYGDKWMSAAANDNDMSFTGHIEDTATGLTYMQARYYDPMIGRFLSNDPMGFADMGGDPAYMNRYAYVANDPVNATDPTGKQTLRFGIEGKIGGGPAPSRGQASSGFIIGTNEGGILEVRPYVSYGAVTGQGSLDPRNGQSLDIEVGICADCSMEDMSGDSQALFDFDFGRKRDAGFGANRINGNTEITVSGGVGQTQTGPGVERMIVGPDLVGPVTAMVPSIPSAPMPIRRRVDQARNQPGSLAHELSAVNSPPPPPLP